MKRKSRGFSLVWANISVNLAVLMSAWAMRVATQAYSALTYILVFTLVGCGVYFIGAKIFQRKFGEEGELANLKEFKVCFILTVVGTLLISLSDVSRELGGLGVVVNLFSGLFMALGTIKYARAKGQSPAWFILGVLGLIIVLLLKIKKASSLDEVKAMTGLELVLALGLCALTLLQAMYLIGFQNPNLFVWFHVGAEAYFWIFIVTVVLISYLIITNRRRVFSRSMWLCIVVAFSSLFFYPQQELIITYVREVRNSFYLFLICFSVVFVFGNCVAWLIRRKRVMVTPEGVVEFVFMLNIITFMWAIYEALTKVIK